jgi:NTE family protein
MAEKISLVLSGGIALVAYEAGAYAALHEHPDLWPEHVAGSSIGAVNAALIAGCPRDKRVQQLHHFWHAMAIEPAPLGMALLSPATDAYWLHAYSWMSVMQVRLFGRPGMFRPRLSELMRPKVTSAYDLSPLRANLERFIDFERLNGGGVRVSVVTTDVETGDEVVFDTHQGDRIGPDHLLASCGFLPDFAPVEIEGRVLGDGGLAANAPIETVLFDDARGGDAKCFVVDLFSAEGDRPASVEQAAARRWDLLFGNQSRQRLRNVEREFQLRWALGLLARALGSDTPQCPEVTSQLSRIANEMQRTVTLLHLSYRAPAHQAGPEKAFDFSRASLAERWEAGFLDMEKAVTVATDSSTAQPRGGICIHRIRCGPGGNTA